MNLRRSKYEPENLFSSDGADKSGEADATWEEPTTPVDPLDPIEPLAPVGSVDPLDPFEPLAPVGTTAPTDRTFEGESPYNPEAELSPNPEADEGSTQWPPTLSVADLDIEIPKLRVRGKKDLLPSASPTLKREGRALDGLREGEDYRVAFYRGADPEAPLAEQDRMSAITQAGDYRAVVTGISDRLEGQVAVPFKVGRSRKPLAALLALLAAVGIFLALYFAGLTPWYDPNAQDGLSGIHGEDLQAYLDAKVEEGSMNITILDRIIFMDGTTQPGEAGFNNLPGNHYDQRLVLTLDDTGEVLYESGAVAPGQSIQYITLNRELDPGIYSATAAVTGYDHETHAEEGTLNAIVEIVVVDQEA